MKTTAIMLALAIGLTGVVAVTPTAVAAPPDLPPNHGGCDYFGWESGDIRRGEIPGYRWHPCV